MPARPLACTFPDRPGLSGRPDTGYRPQAFLIGRLTTTFMFSAVHRGRVGRPAEIPPSGTGLGGHK